MILREFTQQEKITLKDFCEQYGFPYGWLRIINCGKGTPSLELAVQIEEATGGKVRPRDFIVSGKITKQESDCKQFRVKSV